jgi:hypothetical protein
LYLAAAPADLLRYFSLYFLEPRITEPLVWQVDELCETDDQLKLSQLNLPLQAAISRSGNWSQLISGSGLSSPAARYLCGSTFANVADGDDDQWSEDPHCSDSALGYVVSQTSGVCVPWSPSVTAFDSLPHIPLKVNEPTATVTNFVIIALLATVFGALAASFWIVTHLSSLAKAIFPKGYVVYCVDAAHVASRLGSFSGFAPDTTRRCTRIGGLASKRLAIAQSRHCWTEHLLVMTQLLPMRVGGSRSFLLSESFNNSASCAGLPPINLLFHYLDHLSRRVEEEGLHRASDNPKDSVPQAFQTSAEHFAAIDRTLKWVALLRPTLGTTFSFERFCVRVSHALS